MARIYNIGILAAITTYIIDCNLISYPYRVILTIEIMNNDAEIQMIVHTTLVF